MNRASRAARILYLGLGLAIGPFTPARSQTISEIQEFLNPTQMQVGPGWSGFLNIGFMLNMLLVLVLAAVLGAVIGYHPKHVESADTLAELEAPKVYILYAVIGALIGILVIGYGPIVGLVVFGIGGLIRFRTVMRSANLTGRVILVTLIGLACGLQLQHVGVLTTLFAFLLIYVIEARVTYRIEINGLEQQHVLESAARYRAALERHGCRVISEKKNPMKHRVTFLIAGPRGLKRTDLAARVEQSLDDPLKGTVDWETD